MINNLNIESLQDTYYANIKDNSWNAGASYSNSGNTGKPQTSNKNSYGISGGGSSTESNTDSQWVNNQTSIIANNNVNIKVNNNTDLKGSLIASNSDNLNINTGSLTYSNITNFNNTTTKGSGLSTSIGTSADNFFKGTSPNGTTTITNINEGQEKEGTTKATIGKGNITIANNNINDIKDSEGNNLYADLNRDVNNSNEITKDMVTGAANNTIELDNKILWEAPNNVLGATNTLANILAGYLTGKPVKIQIGEKGIEVIGGRLGMGGFSGNYYSAITLGYFVNYYGDTTPNTEIDKSNYTNLPIIFGPHENTHIDQQNKLGPLFLPLYFIDGGISGNNKFEIEADKNGNEAYKNKYSK